jgi:hypothetical protein
MARLVRLTVLALATLLPFSHSSQRRNTSMNKIPSVTLAAVLLMPLAALPAAESKAAKPNIVLILADD